MLEHAGSDLKVEIGGMLAGRAWSGPDMPIAEVERVLPALKGRSSGSSFTIGHEAWDDINRELADAEEKLSVVGWYHTHPGFEVFFSGQDRFSHLAFFREAYQFAIVIDPVRWKTGLFATVDGKIEMFNTFEVACREESAEEMEQYIRTWFPGGS
jgi:proteasome lid subunit RPN8/RPN11